ncbi:MAG: hypothetical protein H6562_16235 [Lewinellaceae bacterium]|nr:hypothetical protein [Lewinella sp.]MCB9280443.1 hypothetical protein [Lewinellaceae bacterium]
MFERKNQKLLSRKAFFKRVIRYFLYSTFLLGVSLGVGMVGYRFLGDMGWTDAFLNASMILTGMGPVDDMKTEGAKLFAGFYALFSGVAFLSVVAVLFAPIAHRFLHLMHLDTEDKD